MPYITAFCIMTYKINNKKNKWSKITKYWNKFDKAVSDFFDEGEEFNEQQAVSEKDDELYLKISLKPLNRLVNKLLIKTIRNKATPTRIMVTLVLIIALFISLMLLLNSATKVNPADNIVPKQYNGTYRYDDGTPMYTVLPVIKYNPNNSHAMLVVKEEVFLRVTNEYEIYADIIYYPTGESIPKREILQKSIAGLPTPPDVMIGKEVPYPNAFNAIVHASVPLKRTINGWVSEKFLINSIENGKFIVLWGKYEKFPRGTVSDILVEYSDEIY